VTQGQLQGWALFIFTVGVPLAIWGFTTEHRCKTAIEGGSATNCEKVSRAGTEPVSELVAGGLVLLLVGVLFLISLNLPHKSNG
jgi:hypothetical protein